MLGILLTILKIIGIILLVLIGLILTAVAVILLVPIRYRGEGACEEKVLSGSVKITWLLHLLSIDISYSSGGTVLSVRLFGKTIYPKTEKPQKKGKEEKAKSQPKKKQKQERPKQETLKPQPERNEQPVSEQKQLEEKPLEENSQEVEMVYEPQTQIPQLAKLQEEAGDVESEAKEMTVEQPKKQSQPQDFQSEHASDTKENEEFKENKKFKETQETKKSKPHRDLIVFVKSKFEAIKTKFFAIKDKLLATKANLQKIKNKIEYWKNLLTSEPMKDAIATLWKRTKGLLRHILPRKLTGRVHFGFDDPSMTGKVLAYLSMLYPFTKDNLVIEPEFETEELILEGNLAFRGRIRLGYLVYVALSVVLNKNIRRQYKRLRQGGKEDGKGRN